MIDEKGSARSFMAAFWTESEQFSPSLLPSPFTQSTVITRIWPALAGPAQTCRSIFPPVRKGTFQRTTTVPSGSLNVKEAQQVGVETFSKMRVSPRCKVIARIDCENLTVIPTGCEAAPSLVRHPQQISSSRLGSEFIEN